jgi:hypothetical protein
MNTPKLRTSNTVKHPALIASTAPEIIKRTVEQALGLLDVTGGEYIIRLNDGTTITKGNIQIKAVKVKPPAKKRALKMPYGSMRNAVMPLIECLKVGDVAEIGFTPEMLAAGVDTKDLLSTVSNAAVKLFGTDSHKVCTNKVTNKIEILRTA